MSAARSIVRRATTGRPRQMLAAAAVLAVAVVAALVGDRSGSTSARAATAHSTSAFATGFQSELGLPGGAIDLFGAAPGPGEVWGTANTSDIPTVGAAGQRITGSSALIEHTAAGGWQLVQRPPSAGVPLRAGAEAGRVTPDGGVVVATQTNLVVRNPGQAPFASSTPGAVGSGQGNAVLGPGESLVTQNPVGAQTVPFAAVDGAGGTGAFVAPAGDAAPYGVLHYDGASDSWTREPILDVPSGDQSFTPEALACGPTATAAQTDSADNCFLLAATVHADSTPGLSLFTRVAAPDGTGAAWVPETVGDQLLGGGAPVDGSATVGAAVAGSQMLTVTSQGVWVDFQATIAGVRTSVSELLTRGAVTGAGSSSPAVAAATSLGSWCYPAGGADCTASLAAPLTTTDANAQGYRSFAWPGASNGDPGTRVITGLGDSAMLELGGPGDFSYAIGPGGNGYGTTVGGAAFTSPSQGWLSAVAGQGVATPQIFDVTGAPAGTTLRSDPVPFGGPLLAVTPAPGSTPGDPGASALAVGVNGQVGRFTPAAGWQPEPLLNGAGIAQHPTLRGVAWPEPGRAYAVGDNGAMWVWQASTGLWEPDPAKPFNFVGNLTGVAFSPTNPSLGYAVGKQGTLLQFGKTWTQVPLGPDLQSVNFTSIAFAGGEAIATYRQADGDNAQSGHESGGIAIDSGSGWTVDTGAAGLLAALPNPGDSVLSKVAGLPDGSAVAAGPGIVIERDGASGSWQPTAEPLPEAANVSAVAGYRDGGALRAIVSIDTNQALSPNILKNLSPTGGISDAFGGDVPHPVGPGQPPVFLGPDPLPDTGYLVRQTAGGWTDMQHALTLGGSPNASQEVDRGARPDPVFGLLVTPDGADGLAVGGVTGNDVGTQPLQQDQETAGIERFGAGGSGSSAGAGTAVVTTDPTQASFVVGGNAICANACADQADNGLSPDVSLTHALSEANGISGARGFLYTGGRLAGGVAAGLGSGPLTREFGRLGQLLGSGGGSPPVDATTSSDVLNGGTPSLFDSQLGAFGPGGSSGTGPPYYAFDTAGSAGPVRVIVLDYSTGALGDTQRGWLASALASARSAGEPAIVVGSASLGFNLPDAAAANPQPASDASLVAPILVAGGASAYLFDYPQANVATTIKSGGGSIPAFGTGTLGYVRPPLSGQPDYLGSSAFLLVSVQTAKRNPATNVAPVTAQAIPNISQLAIDALDGTLLRRSQVGLFEGLARRPQQGTSVALSASGAATFLGPSPYDPIPNTCAGSNCGFQVPEQYGFSSSHADIGNFVKHDSTSSNPRAVALSKQQLPIPDPSSGIFCAFNAGTTTVSLTAGPLTYALPVTVQSGSVRYPCGTVPLTNPPAATKSASTGVPPLPIKPGPVTVKGGGHPKVPTPTPPKTTPTPTTPGPTPTTPQPTATQPSVPTPTPGSSPAPVPLHVVPISHPPAPLPRVPHAGSNPIPVKGLAPPPPPPAARPVPPSGTSQVPSQSNVAENVPMAEKERQEIAAVQKVSNEAVTYDRDAPLPIPGWSIALIVLAAAAGGAGLRSRRRDDDQQPWAWAGKAPRTPAARARTWHRPPPAVRRSSQLR